MSFCQALELTSLHTGGRPATVLSGMSGRYESGPCLAGMTHVAMVEHRFTYGPGRTAANREKTEGSRASMPPPQTKVQIAKGQFRAGFASYGQLALIDLVSLFFFIRF